MSHQQLIIDATSNLAEAIDLMRSRWYRRAQPGNKFAGFVLERRGYEAIHAFSDDPSQQGLFDGRGVILYIIPESMVKTIDQLGW
jgi:hypothetical protein